jgi:hypothetical protein
MMTINAMHILFYITLILLSLPFKTGAAERRLVFKDSQSGDGNTQDYYVDKDKFDSLANYWDGAATPIPTDMAGSIEQAKRRLIKGFHLKQEPVISRVSVFPSYSLVMNRLRVKPCVMVLEFSQNAKEPERKGLMRIVMLPDGTMAELKNSDVTP